jgi:hypothetical protein
MHLRIHVLFNFLKIKFLFSFWIEHWIEVVSLQANFMAEHLIDKHNFYSVKIASENLVNLLRFDQNGVTGHGMRVQT